MYLVCLKVVFPWRNIKIYPWKTVGLGNFWIFGWSLDENTDCVTFSHAVRVYLTSGIPSVEVRNCSVRTNFWFTMFTWLKSILVFLFLQFSTKRNIALVFKTIWLQLLIRWRKTCYLLRRFGLPLCRYVSRLPGVRYVEEGIELKQDY